MTPLQKLALDLFFIVFCSISMNALDKSMEKYSSVITQGIYVVFGIGLIFCWSHLPFAVYQTVMAYVP